MFFAALATAFLTAGAQEQVITLDLTKADTELKFDETNGSWTGTYDDDEYDIESQVFCFIHSSMGDYNTWWGFTASNHCDNTEPANTLAQQWSNMAKGGIVLNEDGTIKKDSFGAVVTSKDVPYLVAFYSPFMSRRPVDMVFMDDNNYEPVGVYVNLNSYSYYSMQNGDSFARAFTNGDHFDLIIHGVAPDETEKEVTVELAKYDNGDLTLTRGWKYVDLSALGVVNELYFTMKSTDSGAYGDNTPEYFCLDKLMVKRAADNAVSSITANQTQISYDSATATVTVSDGAFVALYDVTGAMLKSADNGVLNISDLAAGVYVVKSGNAVSKIAR